MHDQTSARNAAAPARDDAHVDFAEIYKAELQTVLTIGLPQRTAAEIGDESRDGQERAREYTRRICGAVDAHPEELSAVCLSGGGIRSATFALGVIQGLARFGLLQQFHYLSSVSGGGYIASWLSAWRRDTEDEEVFAAVNRSLHTGSEAEQIVGIRADSNYLTPQLGLLSADTWTVLALCLRNLLLNWIMFVPFFLGCLMFPRLCLAVLTWASRESLTEVTFDVCRVAGGVLVVIGLSSSVYGRFRRQGPWLTNNNFCLMTLCPFVTSAALFTLAAVAVGSSPTQSFATEFLRHWYARGPAWGALIYFTAWLVGRLASRTHATPAEKPIEPQDVFYWTVSGAVVGLLAALGMKTIAFGLAHHEPLALEAAEILGFSGFVLAYLVGDLLYAGLASFSRKGDMDREWLARSSGWVSAAAVGWALFSAVAVYVPDLAQRHPLNGVWGAVVGAAGGTSGLTALILGSSGLTAATKVGQTLKSIPLMRLASAAAVVFALTIACLLALIDRSIEAAMGMAVAPPGGAATLTIESDAVSMVALIVIAIGLSCVINVNRFSMHALYRNRLVRAFIGAARAGRRNPDPFTGFDPEDNLHLASLAPKTAKNRLFHVINAALNVVSSENRAWQERKAESFTMSRLHCGNPIVRFRPTAAYGGLSKGGLTLGTAMAISGAAVSPNQGYNSSPLIGFLLMLFNVRLGWWLGSPRKSTYYREGPTRSLSPALRELAGDTTDQSKWVYLSDGGHFENLGLYEMVRRRCRNIVVSDAGCDPSCSFEDLGNAVRKIYIDFGVSVEFEKLEIKARRNPPVPGLRFAIGSIKYPESDRHGWLLYLKPTYQGTERVDVRSYAARNPTFPHETTTDQWFSESQLEAYRALGASITEYICNGGAALPSGATPATMTLQGLRYRAADLLEREIARHAAVLAEQPVPEVTR